MRPLALALGAFVLVSFGSAHARHAGSSDSGHNYRPRVKAKQAYLAKRAKQMKETPAREHTGAGFAFDVHHFTPAGLPAAKPVDLGQALKLAVKKGLPLKQTRLIYKMMREPALEKVFRRRVGRKVFHYDQAKKLTRAALFVTTVAAVFSLAAEPGSADAIMMAAGGVGSGSLLGVFATAELSGAGSFKAAYREMLKEATRNGFRDTLDAVDRAAFDAMRAELDGRKPKPAKRGPVHKGTLVPWPSWI